MCVSVANAAETRSRWQSHTGAATVSKTQPCVTCNSTCTGHNHVEGAVYTNSGQVENQGSNTRQQVSVDAT